MAFRKVSAKEWKKMGLPISILTISFGLSKLRKPSTKKEIKDLKLRHAQDQTKKIPKWLLGKETLYSPKRKEDK